MEVNTFISSQWYFSLVVGICCKDLMLSSYLWSWEFHHGKIWYLIIYNFLIKKSYWFDILQILEPLACGLLALSSIWSPIANLTSNAVIIWKHWIHGMLFDESWLMLILRLGNAIWWYLVDVDSILANDVLYLCHISYHNLTKDVLNVRRVVLEELSWFLIDCLSDILETQKSIAVTFTFLRSI